jgi:hypothetical protein
MPATYASVKHKTGTREGLPNTFDDAKHGLRIGMLSALCCWFSCFCTSVLHLQEGAQPGQGCNSPHVCCLVRFPI